ncbi:proximal sequence element A Pbp95 [Andrena cerasifolii]|uniref:proximal sequence element A Pbp95 n=1 Tax=Andrena cerasifolii TaxID=2819439 RepID=UPI0040378D91
MMDNKPTADESDDDDDFDAKTLLLSGDMSFSERGGQDHYEYTSGIKSDEPSSEGMEVYIKDYTLRERLKCDQAENEFLECDIENCDRMLNSNKQIISFLLDLKKHITAALEKCEKKLTLVETTLRKHSIVDTKVLICNAGIPYFKDRDYFFPPNNEDETLKESYKELQIRNLPRVSPWTPKERNTLLKAIQEEALSDTLSSHKMERTEHANVTLKIPVDANRQEQQKRRIEKFPPRDLKEMIGPLREREFDWFKISSAHFEDIHSPLDCRVMWNVFLFPDINKNCWTRPEDNKLKDIARKLKFQNWDKIAERLNTNRTAYQCFIRYNTTKTLPKIRNCVWENEEDKRLLSLVEIFKIGDFIPWGEMASWMRNRTKQQAYFRWTYSLAPYLRKGRFSKSEDNVLRDAITKYGTNFRKISAALMPNRSTVQLHDRYHTLTTNRVKNWNIWTLENDSKLLELFQRFGPNWSQIATAFSSKTRTQLRHRHAALQRYINRGISILDLNRNRFKSKNLRRQEDKGGEEDEAEGEENEREEDEEEDDGDERIRREEAHQAILDFNNDDPSNGNCNSNVDKELIEYFHREHAIERSVRNQKLYTGQELKCCTKNLYTTLKSLDAELCMPSDIDDLKLRDRDRQLLCSLGEYAKTKHDKAMYLQVIDECSSRMFGTSYTAADKGSHFVPPPPFDSRVKLKKLVKTRCIDYDLNTKNTFLIEKTIDLDTPDFVISQIGGNEQELQFQKISHLLKVYSSKGQQACDTQDVSTVQRRQRRRRQQQQDSSSSNNRNTLSDNSMARCKSIANTLFRSNNIFDHGHFDSRGDNCKKPLGKTTNTATLFSVLEKPRHSVPISSTATIKDNDTSSTVEATYATLQSLKNLMYSKRLNETGSGSNPGQLIIGSKKFIESFSLLETRLEQLFKYPVALSKTVLPEVYAIDTFSYDDVTLKRKASEVSCIPETHKTKKSKSFIKHNGNSTC